MLVLGDAHADDPAKRRALTAACDEAGVDVALQVGDLHCYDLPVPTWFVAGNNEDHDVVEAFRPGTVLHADTRRARSRSAPLAGGVGAPLDG